MTVRLKADAAGTATFLRHPALAGLFLAVSLSACAAKLPPRPVGTATPDPSAVDAFRAATASCNGFRSIEGELGLSGRAGGERVRGRVIAGLEPGGAVRLEAVAPFGAPFFILAGRDERATLVLPRERRVLQDTGVRDVLERITGLALGADDLRLVISGCLVEQASPSDGRQWGADWKAVTLAPERVAYLRILNGQPVLMAADYGTWRVDYSGHLSGFPRVVRIRSSAVDSRPGEAGIDITARIEQLNVNTTINPRAWSVDVPSNADPMTLDELRSIAPLAEKK